MKRSTVLWITALVLGWSFDFLFWEHIPGINFAIFVVLCLGGGFLVLGMEGLKPAWKAFLLVVPILFFAAVTFNRQEPLTVFLAVVFVLLMMGTLSVTVLGGRWLLYSLSDYVARTFQLIGSMIARPIIFLVEKQAAPAEVDPAGRKAASRLAWKRLGAVLGGLLLALPVVAIFASLLASADLIFADRLGDFIDLFRLERLPEYILRGFLIAVIAYLLAGSILHAVQKSRDEKLLGLDKPLVPPFLGFTQAAIVLGAVVALFAVFVTIQFQYFFGGQANINLEGYTYAEYARRGFGELVAVAFFSLVLFLGLSGIVRREGRAQRGAFSGLGIAMVTLIGVMLVSAFQRLLLYEAAYGFSRLRAYTHVFMIWLGIVLAVVVVLDLLHRERQVALSVLLASIGFAASLALLNVDGFIVRQNVARTGELDVAYLVSLSDDAVPALGDAYRDPDLSRGRREAVGAALVCMRDGVLEDDEQDWQSFHLSNWRAEQALQSLDLDDYELVMDREAYFVITPSGEEYDCWDTYYD